MAAYSFSIQPERIVGLNTSDFKQSGKWIVYRMQASVRITDNLALREACRLSRETGKPLKVVFILNPDFPEANYRHFLFLAEGLKEVMMRLQELQIRFELYAGDFQKMMSDIARDAACIITDRGYLRIQREQLEWLGENMDCAVIAVEDNLIVPIESASFKAEWAARTLRPKLTGKCAYFTTLGPESDLQTIPTPETAQIDNMRVLSDFLETIRTRFYLSPAQTRGGETEANRLLSEFVSHKLARYDGDRNHPELQATSRLSAYLHFGMISPLTIYQAVAGRSEAAPFVEQLLVRRELAHNFIYFTPLYDCYEAMPGWARKTLSEHAADVRPFRYDIGDLQNASTHDACWNAAMREMRDTGYMENTMRMYWGKKIIEWTESPEAAFETLLTLNNRYFLDGRDANSFTGVGWCFGLHDRPWQERPVFGMVRYMNEAGLRRKYDMNRYIALF